MSQLFWRLLKSFIGRGIFPGALFYLFHPHASLQKFTSLKLHVAGPFSWCHTGPTKRYSFSWIAFLTQSIWEGKSCKKVIFSKYLITACISLRKGRCYVCLSNPPHWNLTLLASKRMIPLDITSSERKCLFLLQGIREKYWSSSCERKSILCRMQKSKRTFELSKEDLTHKEPFIKYPCFVRSSIARKSFK